MAPLCYPNLQRRVLTGRLGLCRWWRRWWRCLPCGKWCGAGGRRPLWLRLPGRRFRRNCWRARSTKRTRNRMISVGVYIAAACVLLALATLLFVFNVHLDSSDYAPHRTKLDELLERRDAIYDNLRDLRFEYRAGKYSEQDYEE